ncbi:ankyrin repeat and SAM domain-containing protein 6-like [Forsythia ovata]|uniref:Ankyrin repeat and SAM domain-containing protein 6-like n=1 Tax=Forsythia ovata TaxID=205694 RepID=A0ABD1T5W9_9LAMI
MYADRVEIQAKRSVKERLNGNSISDSIRRKPVSGKRQREDDDKWEHDLFEDDGQRVSNRRVGLKDLRLKLQRKSIEQAAQSVRGPLSGGTRDLREKLSGILGARGFETGPLEPKAKPASEFSKPTRSVSAEALVLETKKHASLISKKKTQQKVESVDNFLHSLGLEKYSITFQAEEVDMTALVHMNDEDLKDLGIPMGPRKKILLALESKSPDLLPTGGQEFLPPRGKRSSLNINNKGRRRSRIESEKTKKKAAHSQNVALEMIEGAYLSDTSMAEIKDTKSTDDKQPTSQQYTRIISNRQKRVSSILGQTTGHNQLGQLWAFLHYGLIV